MKAAVLYGKNNIKYEEIQRPQIKKKNEVLVRVKACGICKSDVPRVVDGTAKKIPLILGHEFAGEVVEVGTGVSQFCIGDHVAGIPLVPCFECEDCKAGHFSLCTNYSFIGSRRHGAYAEFVVLPESNIIKIDDSIPFEQAALIETATVALHPFYISGKDRTNLKNVAIVGTGTIGVFAVQWARILSKMKGIENIVVIGRNESRLSFAKEMGATHCINTKSESCLEDVFKITNGKGFDYILETAGAPDTIKLCFQIAANKADICMIGTPTKDFTFSWKDWELMNRREFSVTGSWMSYSDPWPGAEWSETVHRMTTGELIYDERLLHKVISLPETENIFDSFSAEKVTGRIMINI